jgi:hypothetical protein
LESQRARCQPCLLLIGDEVGEVKYAHVCQRRQLEPIREAANNLKVRQGISERTHLRRSRDSPTFQ